MHLSLVLGIPREQTLYLSLEDGANRDEREKLNLPQPSSLTVTSLSSSSCLALLAAVRPFQLESGHRLDTAMLSLGVQAVSREAKQH